MVKVLIFILSEVNILVIGLMIKNMERASQLIQGNSYEGEWKNGKMEGEGNI